jgi:hypothetical protein
MRRFDSEVCFSASHQLTVLEESIALKLRVFGVILEVLIMKIGLFE